MAERSRFPAAPGLYSEGQSDQPVLLSDRRCLPGVIPTFNLEKRMRPAGSRPDKQKKAI